MFADELTQVEDDTIVNDSLNSDFEYVFVDIVALYSILFWTLLNVVLVICEDDRCSCL